MQEGNDKQAEGHWYNEPASTTGEPNSAGTAKTAKEKTVVWTASEFIAHHKGTGWYATLALGTVVLAALIFWLTRDRITTIVIVVSGLLFGIMGARKPRVLTYQLDDAGLTIGAKFYPYANYKAFAVVDEGPFASISFLPLKRFMPALSIYFAPEDEERIVGMLAGYLPLQPPGSTTFDNIIRRMRF